MTYQYTLSYTSTYWDLLGHSSSNSYILIHIGGHIDNNFILKTNSCMLVCLFACMCAMHFFQLFN